MRASGCRARGGNSLRHPTVSGGRLAPVSYPVQEESRPVSKPRNHNQRHVLMPTSARPSNQTLLAGDDNVLEKAREELLRAEETYRRTLERAAAGASQARDITVGDMIDGSLEFVRRHPVAGLLAVSVSVSWPVARRGVNSSEQHRCSHAQ